MAARGPPVSGNIQALVRGDDVGEDDQQAAGAVFVRIDGADRPLTEELRAEITAANDEYARNGLRVLAVAWREDIKPEAKNEPIRGLTVGQNEVTLNELWESAPRQSRRI